MDNHEEFLKTLEGKILDSGFQHFGITEAVVSSEDKENIQDFIEQKFYGSMDWFPDRQNIRIGFENLGFQPRSILSMSVVYKPQKEAERRMESREGKVARYAYGEDYHLVLKKKARPILEFLHNSFPGKKFRMAVDSLPIPEKILARNAGLGWIGKNTLLIHPEIGSYFFLTEILCEPDLQFLKNGQRGLLADRQKDRCGSCNACINACPTRAIVAPYQLDARKCISHHTIEYEGEFTEEMKTHGWVFGCDICQEVCPWNRVKAEKRKIETRIEEFSPLPVWDKPGEEMMGMKEEEFQESFRLSPVIRSGLKGWIRNLKATYPSSI